MPSLPAPCPDPGTSASIGVFDSGVGGLTILRALCARLPQASLHYVGDVANAPWGGRPDHEIVARSIAIADSLRAQGAALIVVACNTATVIAIEALRARWPQTEFVGVEPGVKPAATRSASGRIAIMATPATVASARLVHLLRRHAAATHVHLEPCPGLAAAIEAGLLDGPRLDALIAPHCDAILRAGVDTVVLGCTHYGFVEAEIRRRLGPGIAVLDTAAAVAERAASLWERTPRHPEPAPFRRVVSTGTPAMLQQLLRRCEGFEAVEVEVDG